ncbi:hypothetical protein mru_0641 [Methanobrevibacter ruminantium M1]|uniref:Uncharacterized protein n=1 Tax=Methanobrevibacter ruminantium (strain ATCC 35063 / DSM 1093 / JCM 13430 / OCM 146 / M1) TaxID=634498 RepID=D3E1T1_METRM|nr:hypothetical protein mru_0641 [Methanobrevibacter ruminantium M1]
MAKINYSYSKKYCIIVFIMMFFMKRNYSKKNYKIGKTDIL